jgi:hypothetical protein
MNPFSNIVLQSAVMYGCTAVCLSVSVVLFVWTRLHFRALERHLIARQTEMERLASELRDAFGKVAGDISALERRSIEAAAAPPGRSLNLSQRSHALRMHRRGDSADHIAAALNLPRQEVELLLRVHSIVLSSGLAAPTN